MSEELRVHFREGWARFQESRLHAQVVATLLAVGLLWLAALLPIGPSARVRGALLWVTRTDYDFVLKARQTLEWVERRGGWEKAAAGLWADAAARARAWAKLPPAASRTPAGSSAVTGAPAVPAAKATTGAPAALTLPVNGAVLYGFGWLPQSVSREFHNGLDLAAPVGSTVLAVADGTVLRTYTDPKLGGAIEINHGAFLATYAQVDHIQVRPGDRVRSGQLLASVARPTGAEQKMAAHLHLEIRPGAGKAQVDPSNYLSPGGNKP